MRLFGSSPLPGETYLLAFISAAAAAIALANLKAPEPFSQGAQPDSRQVNESAARAQEASRIEQSYPIIFHEIRNYASTLKGNTILLRKNLGEEGGSQPSLERLERATERIEKLSKDVLEFSLLGRPGESLEVDLQGLIKSCAERYFSGLGITFSFTSDRAALPIKGEESKLEQVFLNLFKNSLEAGASLISISIFAQPGKIGVLLEDNGKGCTSPEVEKMFDAYHSFKRSQGGSGLGLFLVKAIVEGHGGTIAGISKNEKLEGANGMIFVLHFPSLGAA
jgi:signal transduction histidine kinase